MRSRFAMAVCCLIAAHGILGATTATLWLDTLDVSRMSSGLGNPIACKSAGENALRVGGKLFSHGVGTHAPSELWIETNQNVQSFSAIVGVDEEGATSGSVVFEIWADGRQITTSPLLRKGDPGFALKIDLSAARQVVLVVNDGGDGMDGDHADWCDAAFLLKSGKAPGPKAVIKPEDTVPHITHKSPQEPWINGPAIVGTTPRKPFLFLIPATGNPPLKFSVDSSSPLPQGLHLDGDTGIIAGSVETTGTHPVNVTVTNSAGTATRQLTIVAEKGKLALTPPMGWNSWNAWSVAVDQPKVREAAEWMIKSGLAAHGYAYINIDDAWQGKRSPKGELSPKEYFPDMRALAAHVHAKGLKLGIYSSPGPVTCAGYPAAYKHEDQDAQTFARWGMDYLKYDWCSYATIAPDPSREQLMAPYILMRQALDATDRDFVFSICQYGMGNVCEWGAQAGGNLWRTTGDISDTWGVMSHIGFSQNGKEEYAGPGHWNDPDMLVVGNMGWGAQTQPTKLSKHEQITHMTLWSLLAAPLLIGCDLSHMDEFTLALLTNDEVIAVNQDALGRPASKKTKVGDSEVWARPLEDGSTAVGLFNRGLFPMEVAATWNSLGLKGKMHVRDLWQQKDLGEFENAFSTRVASHGAVLVKMDAAEQWVFQGFTTEAQKQHSQNQNAADTGEHR